ncbi:MAG TPA: MFS transporter [Candidatus Copromorpha excrementigallinarum]|uniref:MFS transporter n=1 Tax=Candidatus Allocopromorpha excrementigallinarum TaxID=2840742 RepID=A0A9D1HYR2_9FIRM|nr:MFS transporter [Candidatus Copromorpha excrementigallinarum]
MEKSFNRYKWISLLSFAFMYNFVYTSRFSVNNMMENFARDISITEAQQEMISASVFVFYALGSFVNGYLADRYGGKKLVVTGGVMSACLNIGVTLQTSWIPVLVIWSMNGYFQSMIWLGGISIFANWWKEGERGKGIGTANFFSGMSHVTAYVLPLMILSMAPGAGWKNNIIIPALILLGFVMIFSILGVEKPEDRGLKPYEAVSERHRKRERILKKMAAEGKKPWKFFALQKNFWWWCAIAMLSSLCRYGLLYWIPLYYDERQGAPLLSESFSNLILPIGMAFGTLIITWVAGTKTFNNKGIIVIAMAAICGTLVVMFPMIDNTQSVLVGIFLTGFVLYGINGILWVHAIDQGCRVFAGTAAGIFNGFAYIGTFAQEFIFDAVTNLFGTNLSVFVLMEIFCIMMVVCGMAVSKKNTVVAPEVKE